MPLRRVKFLRQATAELARAIRSQFPHLPLRLSVNDTRVVVSGRRLDVFTQRELTTIAQQYFTAHQIRFRSTTAEPPSPKH